MFSNWPALVAVISTDNVQLDPAVIVAPAGSPKARVEAPAPGDQVGVPAQFVFTLGVPATSKPAGRESVNFTPVRATATPFVLLIVKVNVETPLTVIGSVPKLFVIVGGGSLSKQPLNKILSRKRLAPELSFNAPVPDIRNTELPP